MGEMRVFNLSIFRKQGIGLVLSGGGARGFFHIGVLNALRDNKVKINKISGTSVGAIVGALYAANPEINFEELLKELSLVKISTLIASTYNKKTGTDLENFLQTYIKAHSFEELKMPFSFSATDINNKKEIVFESGKLFPALLASFAIPGIFQPVKHEEKFLVDGGVINNIPVAYLKDEDRIVISDITGSTKKVDEKTSSIDVLYASLAVAQQRNSLNFTEMPDYKDKELIWLELSDTPTFMLDFRKKNYRKLIELGYEAAQKALPKIL